MIMDKNKAEKIYDAIIGILMDRKGFDEWWHDVEEQDIKDEIVNTLQKMK